MHKIYILFHTVQATESGKSQIAMILKKHMSFDCKAETEMSYLVGSHF